MLFLRPVSNAAQCESLRESLESPILPTHTAFQSCAHCQKLTRRNNRTNITETRGKHTGGEERHIEANAHLYNQAGIGLGSSLGNLVLRLEGLGSRMRRP